MGNCKDWFRGFPSLLILLLPSPDWSGSAGNGFIGKEGGHFTRKA